jgi:hypothetical protein
MLDDRSRVGHGMHEHEQHTLERTTNAITAWKRLKRQGRIGGVHVQAFRCAQTPAPPSIIRPGTRHLKQPVQI